VEKKKKKKKKKGPFRAALLSFFMMGSAHGFEAPLCDSWLPAQDRPKDVRYSAFDQNGLKSSTIPDIACKPAIFRVLGKKTKSLQK